MNIQDYLKKIIDLPLLSHSVLQAVEHFDITLRVDNLLPKSRLCTYEINYYVDNVDYALEDVLSVSLFSYEFGIPVYSDPPSFDIAVINPKGFGYVPNPDWEQDMKTANINPDLVKKIRSVLKSKPPVDY